jgi:hypothetical protein
MVSQLVESLAARINLPKLHVALQLNSSPNVERTRFNHLLGLEASIVRIDRPWHLCHESAGGFWQGCHDRISRKR